jgi:threonine synthase
MGAGGTPLLSAVLDGWEVSLKPEYFAPTGSFKDRGTAVMINILAHQGVTHVADDSSGNAGASVAAYAARAGMRADIFVPALASPAKQAQIAVYGATVRPIPGPRGNAKLAALEATEQGITFASHAYHPGFLLGQQSVAWELWEQMERQAPDWYVVPVGQGVHLLGVWLGFRRLRTAGLVERVPRLVAVQPMLMAPLCRAFEAGLESVPAVEPGEPSVAEGLAISAPVRGRRLLQAVRESGGTCIMVEEESIHAAQRLLAHRGFFAEPTSATVVAALDRVKALAGPDASIVMPLTGSGLKGSPILT